MSGANMRYIGLMSGTSVDGIDAAVASILPSGKLSLEAVLEYPLARELTNEIHRLCQPGANELDRLGELDAALGAEFANAVNALLASAGLNPTDIRAIGSHGQTVRHRPDARHPFTVQVGNASVIAERTGITTIADFRMRDIAAGGQGAPLVPAFHRAQFGAPDRHRAIVNVGGIANVTYLPALADEPVLGFDTGPGNTLLDHWIRLHRGESCDRQGAWSAGGHVHEPLLQRLVADAYFARRPPKSTGREYFNLDWLQARLTGLGDIAPVDVQATLAELTGCTIARALDLLPACNEIYLCGGGCHNDDFVQRLKRRAGKRTVATTGALGLNPDWVEAAAFAWLAHRTMEGLPGNLPSVTGAQREVVLGGIYRS
jgi:anhydro-N-acetylmuramic acid kinase